MSSPIDEGPFDDVEIEIVEQAEERSVLHRFCTSNPFYAVSAAMFLAGLWLSFGDPERAEDTTALMSGLAGYTLLLAGTACLLVPFAKVWDDARTVLLLVVLMFLATSVTFDHTIVFDLGRGEHPIRGYTCNVLGLMLAIGISAVVLRIIKLQLPTVYRWPYYLLLLFYFGYPLALAPFLHDPKGNGMMWGLFAFASVAGVMFLTLLPAICLGAGLMRDNGSPWLFPYYPWSLFGVLALAVPGRAILLCYSMHLIDVQDLYDMTFGPYFLVPFGFALTILLLEAGLVTKRRSVITAALVAPAGLILLSMIGHRDESIYVEFLDRFTRQLGGTPFFLALIAAIGFFIYAILRKAPLAIEGLIASLTALAFVSPRSIDLRELSGPRPEPLLLAASLMFAVGIYRRGLARCLSASMALAAGIVLAIPHDSELTPYRWIIAFHVVVSAMLMMGAVFNDEFGAALRFIASGLLVLAGVAFLFVPVPMPNDVPVWTVLAYPLVMAVVLLIYGWSVWYPPTLVMASLMFVLWGTAVGWQMYRVGRQVVVGLDYLTLSLIVFAVAIAMSLVKSGHLSRGLAWLRKKAMG